MKMIDRLFVKRHILVVDWFEQMRLYNIVWLKAGMSCHRYMNKIGAKRFCLLTVVLLAVIFIFVVNSMWLTKDKIRFIKELGQKNNITPVYNLGDSSKNTSQQHLDKHITKRPTGKTFSFAPMNCNNVQ